MKNLFFSETDEATSSLSEQVETKLYEHCAKMGMAVLSVGHRSSLLQHHHTLIQLTENHSFTLHDLASGTL